MNRIDLYKSLVEHFHGQSQTAVALGVKQPTVHGWVAGIHGMSPPIARRAERRTGGKFAAADLCADLADDCTDQSAA